MPHLELPTSDGDIVDMATLGAGRTVICCYPLFGRPGLDLPQGWDEIPGARGCSTKACTFRNHLRDSRTPVQSESMACRASPLTIRQIWWLDYTSHSR